MIKIFSKSTRFLLSIVILFMALPLVAQTATDAPMMTFRSHRLETFAGSEALPMVGFSLMSTEPTEVKVDFGDGYIETYTVTGEGSLGEDEEFGTLVGGTFISGILAGDGIVRVWGDASKIDYLDLHGSEVYDLDINQLTQLTILSLSHNEIPTLDLSGMTKLQYIDLADNTFENGLTIGDNHPALFLLNLNQLGDGALPTGTVDLSPFTYLEQFTAWNTKCLRSLNTTQNQRLRRISVDNSGLSSIDVSQNPFLQILNVSECGFTQLDVTNNPYLVQLYVTNEARGTKLSSIDLSQNGVLECMFIDGNNLTDLDLSLNPEMQVLHASNNRFRHLDISMLDNLIDLDLSCNYFDFANLPDPSPACGENLYYYYDLQKPWKVDFEYAVGQTLDLSAHALREDTESLGMVFTVSETGIEDPEPLVDGVDYIYEDGSITFLTAQTDSVFCLFFNSYFDGCAMTTTYFLVRPAEEYGQPVTLFSVTPENNPDRDPFNIVYVCDGEEKTLQCPYDGQKHEILGAVGASVTSLSIDAPYMLKEVDLSKLRHLEQLNLRGCALRDLDLQWNHRLTYIDVAYNQLSTLDLRGINDAYNKNVLNEVIASNNQIKKFYASVPSTLTRLVLNDNKLEEIDLENMWHLKNLSLNNNHISEIQLKDCSALETLKLSHNQLKALDLTSQTDLTYFEATDNRMKYSTMPLTNTGCPTFQLAPQQPVTIAATAMIVDLKSEFNVQDCPTIYTWFNAETGAKLTEGEDYRMKNGKTQFTDAVKGQPVYCVLTNDAFPEFTGDKALRTTTTIAAGEPEYIAASFSTPVGGQTAALSLAAAVPNTYIYIDWGDGDLEEYALQTTYQIFSGKTIAGANVRVLSNTLADGGITVFSIGNVSMSSVNVSAMERLYCLTIDNAGLTDIDLSHNPDLHELSLGGNNLSAIDLSHNDRLTLLYLSDNHFSTLDVSNCHNLGWLQAANNEMTSVNVSGLKELWALDLTHNLLTDIDVTTCSGLYQIFVAENQLHSIDLSNNHSLNVANLNNNFFDFSTLPIPAWNVYWYANQAPLQVTCVDGKVDLSLQSEVEQLPSKFYWFVGEIEYTYDEDGNLDLVNQELEEDVDYFVNNGVITFAQDWPALTGLVVNEIFPDILLFTETISVTATGLNAIEQDEQAIEYYSLDGRRLKSEPTRGAFIRQGEVRMK